MAYSIEQLKGLFSQKSGPARSNSFKVTLPSFPGSTPRDLDILCREANLPSRQISTYDKEIGTVREKVAYGSTHDDVTLSFLLLNDYGVKRYFEEWQRVAYDPVTKQIGYKSDYSRQVTITQLQNINSIDLGPLNISFTDLGPINVGPFQLNVDFNNAFNSVYTCKLLNAWPVTIESIPLTNELDGLVELRVQLAYTEWTSVFHK
jgi:hypothetical protein